MAVKKSRYRGAAQNLTRFGGFSMNAQTGRQPTTGWFVARKSDTDLESIKPGNSNGPFLAEFHGRHHAAVGHEGHIGGWVSPAGHGEIEPSHRYPDTLSGFNAAAADMVNHRQMAIFNPARGGETYTNSRHPLMGTGGPEWLDTPEAAENHRINQRMAAEALRQRFPAAARSLDLAPTKKRTRLRRPS